MRNMVPFRKSLAFRVLFLSFILLSLPLLVDAFILLRERFQQGLENAKAFLQENAKVVELPLSDLFPIQSPNFDLIVYALDLKKNFPAEPQEKLNEALARIVTQGGFAETDLIKKTGDNQFIVIASSNKENLGRNDTEFIQALEIERKEEDTYFIYISGEKEHYFTSVRLIYSEEEKLQGVMVIYTDISEGLNRLLLPDLERYPVSFAVLFEDTFVAASTDPALVFQYLAPITSVEKKRIIIESKLNQTAIPNNPLPVTDLSDYPFFEFKWKGAKYLGLITNIPNTHFYLLTYSETSEIYSYLFFNFFHVYGTYALILCFGGGIAYLLSKRFARPLNTLTAAMKEIEKGRLDVRVPSDKLGFEINILSSTFNEMLDTLLEKKKLAEEERVKWEIYKKELTLGESVQKRLYLEKKLPFKGIDVTTRYYAAKEVGGDFCDLFLKEKKGHKKYAIAIADAAGKGVEACFYSLLARGLLRTFAREYDNVATIIQKTNQLFLTDTSDTGVFVTLFMGFYDPFVKEFEYYSAGHPPPILLRNTGVVEKLESFGAALGVEDPQGEKESKKVKLDQDDLIVFYTDGIIEAHNEKDELYGEERLIQVIQQEKENSADLVADAVVADVKRFASKTVQHDDITLIVMRVV